MHRSLVMTILALGLAFSLAGRVEAQVRGGMGGGGWGGVDLLLHPIVQKELKLDEAQVEKARALALEIRERQKEQFAKLEGLEHEERVKKSQEFASALAEEGLKALGGLLKPEQLARFRQVDLQQRGASALTDPTVIRSLRLRPDQSARLQAILDHSVLRMREAPSLSRGDRQATFDRILAIRHETNAAAVGLLDDPQKEAWKRMLGEPLELNSPGRSTR
jgi:hypothetical protein